MFFNQKKKIIIFDDEINSESIGSLVVSLINTKEKNIELYFSSDGGDTGAMEVLLHNVNRIAQKKNLTLFATGFLQSAGFNFFLFAECKKVVLSTACGMIHKVWSSIGGKVITESPRLSKTQRSFLNCSINENNELFKKFYAYGVPEHIIEDVKNGHEIYIPNDQFKRIFDKHQFKNKKLIIKETLSEANSNYTELFPAESKKVKEIKKPKRAIKKK